MNKGKIINIEDRIPKIKEHRKHRANRRLMMYLSVFFLLILAIIYLQSSFSHVKSIEVRGHVFTSKNMVIEKSGITVGKSMWTIKTGLVKERIEKIPIVKSVDIKRAFPNRIVIQIEEYKPVAYLKRDKSFIAVLENGKFSPDISNKELQIDAPVLVGFQEDQTLNELTSQLKELPDGLNRKISEVHKQDPFLKLYMTDGQIVIASANKLKEQLSLYPTIIKQLDPNVKGILHLEVTPYFESLPPKEEEQ